MDLQHLRDSIRPWMGEGRFRHTLGVEEVACDLALIHGCDMEKASIAGILHDCAKDRPDEKLLEECLRYQLPMREVERQKPYLLHGKVGAAYAEDIFGIKDEDILNAIRYHTTGRPGMSKLEKIIFIADYIESGRKPLPGMDKIRWEAYNHLDRAIILTTENILKYLESTGTVIDSLTRDTYEYYKELTSEEL